MTQRIASNLETGEKIEVTMVTGQIDVVLFNGWVWIQGLQPGMNYRVDTIEIGDELIEENGWMSRKEIRRVRRVK
jgi:hypothetical protein